MQTYYNLKEIFTEFTENAEKQTMRLAKIPIDIRITQAEKRLRAGCTMNPDKRMVQKVRQLNRNILRLLDGLIAFKEKILRDVLSCNLYTANYPLLIEHILREAKLYRQTIAELEEKGLNIASGADGYRAVLEQNYDGKAACIIYKRIA